MSPVLFLLLAAVVCGQSTGGFEYFRPDKDLGRRAAALAAEMRAGLPPAPVKSLAPLPADEVAANAAGSWPKRVGLHRDPGADSLAIGRWEQAATGRTIWRVAIRSIGAEGVRGSARRYNLTHVTTNCDIHDRLGLRVRSRLAEGKGLRVDVRSE